MRQKEKIRYPLAYITFKLKLSLGLSLSRYLFISVLIVNLSHKTVSRLHVVKVSLTRFMSLYLSPLSYYDFTVFSLFFLFFSSFHPLHFISPRACFTYIVLFLPISPLPSLSVAFLLLLLSFSFPFFFSFLSPPPPLPLFLSFFLFISSSVNGTAGNDSPRA